MSKEGHPANSEQCCFPTPEYRDASPRSSFLACTLAACGNRTEDDSADADVGVDADVAMDAPNDATDSGSGAAVCGDGVVELPESCEPGTTYSCDDFGFAYGVAACGDDCVADTSRCNNVPVCGDGAIDGDETCDDGNAQDNDGCSSDCQTESCGDGIIQGDEECDGDELVPCTDGFFALQVCGDSCTIEDPGVRRAGELRQRHARRG